MNKAEKRLSTDLRTMARDNGLCDLWFKKWKDRTDVDTLLDMYVRGLDFCIENDYPPLDFIRENFSKGDLHRHHVYLDDEVNVADGESGTYVFLGKCTGKVCFGGFAVANVYLRHDSDIEIYCSGYSKVFVSLHNNAKCSHTTYNVAAYREYDRR